MARWPAGGTRDSTRVLGLPCLVGSRVVLIQWAALGRFMRRGRQWACAGAGLLNSWFGPKKPWYPHKPHLFLASSYMLEVLEVIHRVLDKYALFKKN